jgi:hypothetical protein
MEWLIYVGLRLAIAQATRTEEVGGELVGILLDVLV